MARSGGAVSTGAATRLAYTIGLIKWVALGLIALGVLGGTALGLAGTYRSGGALPASLDLWRRGRSHGLRLHGMAAADAADARRDCQEHCVRRTPESTLTPERLATGSGVRRDAQHTSRLASEVGATVAPLAFGLWWLLAVTCRRILVAGQLPQAGGLADAEVAGSGSAYSARPPKVMNLNEAAADTSLQSGDQDVSLRQRAQDLGDEEFETTLPFLSLLPPCALSGRAAPGCLTSCPLPIGLSHREPHRSCGGRAGCVRCSSASTPLHRASESCPFWARSRMSRMMRRQAAGDSRTARTWSSSVCSTWTYSTAIAPFAAARRSSDAARRHLGEHQRRGRPAGRGQTSWMIAPHRGQGRS